MEAIAYLFSVRPNYAFKIIRGEKRFEYRRIKAKLDLSTMVIYATSPICSIIGEVHIDDVIIGHPLEIWKQTYMYSGIEKNDFTRYFNNHHTANAYCLSAPQKYYTPISLLDIGITRPPQSFIYLSEEQITKISKLRHRN